jgi:protein involved in sex pheromone biosynthesis
MKKTLIILITILVLGTAYVFWDVKETNTNVPSTTACTEEHMIDILSHNSFSSHMEQLLFYYMFFSKKIEKCITLLVLNTNMKLGLQKLAFDF